MADSNLRDWFKSNKFQNSEIHEFSHFKVDNLEYVIVVNEVVWYGVYVYAKYMEECNTKFHTIAHKWKQLRSEAKAYARRIQEDIEEGAVRAWDHYSFKRAEVSENIELSSSTKIPWNEIESLSRGRRILMISRGGGSSESGSGVYRHYGVLDLDNKKVYDITKNGGFSRPCPREKIFSVSMEEFMGSHKNLRIHRVLSATSDEEMRQRIWRNIIEDYHLATNNCEHFARGVTCDKKESQQVQTAAAVAGGAGVGMFLAALFSGQGKKD